MEGWDAAYAAMAHPLLTGWDQLVVCRLEEGWLKADACRFLPSIPSIVSLCGPYVACKVLSHAQPNEKDTHCRFLPDSEHQARSGWTGFVTCDGLLIVASMDQDRDMFVWMTFLWGRSQSDPSTRQQP